MLLKIRLYLLLIIFPAISFAQSELHKITFLEDTVTINSPVELIEMSDEMFKFKYRMSTKPTLILSDEAAEVNLIANFSNIKISEKMIVAFKDNQIKQLGKKNESLKILDSGVKIVNGRKISYCKFQTDAIDQKIFNYYFFIVHKNKVLMFTFNCLNKLKSKWEKVADEIVMSVRLK
ncbi:MAG: hypothetical protein HRT69_16925 [Flavobacteriaceae bacterium]|nr:hypothetical protein [Flavobacteriaceae bacterium]